MGHPQLDDLNEQAGDESIAKALGITVDELEELDYSDIETNESNDGLVYSYYLEIQKESSSQAILDKVMENTDCEDNGEYVTVYLDLEDEPDDDDGYYDDEDDDDSRIRPTPPPPPVINKPF